MKTDPTDTGGLFVGRRPGTRPVRYRKLPERASARRQALDRWLAVGLLILMGLVCLMFWGPLPLGWLWIGSQVDYQTGSTFFGMVVTFFGLLGTLMLGLKLMRQLDLTWILVRRAAGYDQREGTIGRVFAIASVIGAILFFIWLLLIVGPGSSFSPNQ
jgi:hypothetical protein